MYSLLLEKDSNTLMRSSLEYPSYLMVSTESDGRDSPCGQQRVSWQQLWIFYFMGAYSVQNSCFFTPVKNFSRVLVESTMFDGQKLFLGLNFIEFYLILEQQVMRFLTRIQWDYNIKNQKQALVDRPQKHRSDVIFLVIIPKQQFEAPKKLNVTTVFNSNVEVQKATNNANLSYNSSNKRLQAYDKILNEDIVSVEKLRQLAWDGIPVQYRSKSWKLMLKYLPTNLQNIEQTLARKRKDYFVMVDTYIEHPTLQRDAQQQKIFKLIIDDVNRTLPESTLIRNESIQKLMRKVLYVWHMRHPASGYVQGINDIVTPFLIVFLSDYVNINLDTLALPSDFNNVTQEQLGFVEADCYWCLCKVLDHILDNYTSSWPGITKSFSRLKEVINRVDPELLQHFEEKQIDFYHMYFKWVTCLLLRQFSVKTGLRLFDTYIADENNYFAFSLYILAAIILKYSKKFKKMKFEQMMIFQQNMPTKQWSEQDLATVIAEAYVYQNYFNSKK